MFKFKKKDGFKSLLDRYRTMQDDVEELAEAFAKSRGRRDEIGNDILAICPHRSQKDDINKYSPCEYNGDSCCIYVCPLIKELK